jgi:hypothetical protein
MRKLSRRVLVTAVGMICAAAQAGEWSAAVEVRHEETLCLSYQAKLDGGFLVVRAAIEPGWHTFAMDNKRRAEEKLAGKRSLSVDQPTQIVLTGGLEAVGGWYQTPPKDFSRPELRWFSWGFEREALFVTRVKRLSAAGARIALRGQACTETTCKNIDVAFPLAQAGVHMDTPAAEINWKNLERVR